MRLAPLVAAAVLVVGCSESTAPNSLVGTFSLTTVNGQSLPYLFQQSGVDTVLLTSSFLRLDADNSWLMGITFREDSAGTVTTHTEGAVGTWTRGGNALTLTETGGATHAVAVSGTQLTVTWGGSLPVLVYGAGAADNTPPTVVSRSPASGATVPLAQLGPVTIAFSEVVDVRSAITGSGLTLTGPSGSVAGHVRYGRTWDTLQFVADAPLTFGATYTAKIAGTVTDLAGNALGADVTWSFTPAAFDMAFVLVPAGTFQMGDQFGDGNGDELPVHSVTITHAFYLGRHEVTQAQWRAVLGTDPSNHASCDSCPVEQVSWDMAQQFIAALNAASGQAGCTIGSGCYRLPTEAEWEYAAKGGPTPGDGTEWAGSNAVGTVAWYSVNSGSATHPVGRKAANGLGLYDMSGNVWEWVQDWWSGSYYSTSPSTDPGGPATGTYRVLRGGSFPYDAGECRVANRALDYPDGIYPDDGFRLLRVQ
jgi:formylglycine-generating enzyme required for sulfatase activity